MIRKTIEAELVMEKSIERLRWEDLDPEKLSRLLDLNATSGAQWKAKESEVILRHQLSAPLLPDLLLPPGAEAARLQDLVRCGPATGSFGEQLSCHKPSLELLKAIKTFARHAGDDAASPLRGNPANVLYFAAIAAAIDRCAARISKLSDEALREGFLWASCRSGAEALKPLYLRAKVKLLP